MGVLQYSLKDGRLEVGKIIIDECLDCGNLGTSGAVSRGTVSEWNGSISEVEPGGVVSRRRGEGVGRNADNSEGGELVRGAHGPKEFFDVVYFVEKTTSGAY